MERIVNVKDLGGKDCRNTTLPRGGGSISILWRKEIQCKRIIHLKMNWMTVITAQVCLLLLFFLFARYWFFKPLFLSCLLSCNICFDNAIQLFMCIWIMLSGKRFESHLHIMLLFRRRQHTWFFSVGWGIMQASRVECEELSWWVCWGFKLYDYFYYFYIVENWYHINFFWK